jgi:alkylresorcinol/alkylpyrone synthase
MVELLSVSTAVPPYTAGPSETKAYLSAALPAARAARFAAVVDSSRIRKRHTSAPVDDLLRPSTREARNEKYVRDALALTQTAASGAIAASGISPDAIDTIIPVSCTGYMMPSLDAHLANRLHLNPSARRIPLTEVGCAAGVGALGIAQERLRGEPSGTALVVSVELCSLSLQLEEPSPSDILGGILFGDGAAAAVLAAHDRGRGPEVLASRSVLWADTLSFLGMSLTSTGLRLSLSPALPRLLQKRLRPTVADFLRSHGLVPEDLGFHVVHPGGPKILMAVGESLGLPDDALRCSWNVLERYGNMSSATVFFVLRELQDCSPPADGDLGLMLAFGPGLTCEMVLLRWRGRLAGGV